MNPPAPNLICPECGTANSIHQVECHHCQVPLLKRYLWAIGSALDHYSVGELVGDRYLVQGKHLLLDLLPGEPAPSVDNTAQLYRPYLRLFPKRPHVPELFGALSLPEGELLLLEHAPVSCIDIADAKVVPGLTHAAPLTTIWDKANLVRRLNWLWQIISLWPALVAENVALTLLNPQLLRAEGSLVRLLQLQAGNNPTLADLGQFWQTHFNFTDQGENFQQAFTILCQQMQDPREAAPESVRQTLEVLFQQALDDLGYEYHYDIASRSDQGPSRSRNEDKCLPQTDLADQSRVLALVCDGVGGHEGGDVASGLAIDILAETLKSLNLLETPPATVEQAIQTAIHATNDAINQRNDTEQRHERQRMGTTVVGALIEHAHLYLAHIGDSRAYWINRWGCYQLTLDDDVASRDVRLGMSTYHQALELPYGGSLVQALGMAPSQHLHPTVERFLLDEEGILLLCSDGLSDFNRVETYWRQYLLPVLQGRVSLTAAAEQLIDLANRLNGHDNVTVVLIHCRVKNTAGVLDLDYSNIVCQGELPEVTDITMGYVPPPEPSELNLTVSQVLESPQPQLQQVHKLGSQGWLLLLIAVGVATAAFSFLAVMTSMNRSNTVEKPSSSPLIAPK
ncbi:phosphoprotein phosphatase [Thermosynechococcus sp. NK55a]|uniref:PP2C family protein-serine/threonine phosphatase n=2 Tax=unclassified Thermosynechococcus TaxID=2622553 RepID=UPI0003D802CB|nr:PP2C family serine/threonine-protein phosphatase [Thermosynechococcus sp. NK55a]AHB89476.1 phosphoprotein phosphatase [Thermosynechococcus sp. NK55a]